MAEEQSDAMRLLVSGLPAAGKTTFLAALWQVFETDGFPSVLEFDSYVGDQRYIIEINRAWASCEKLERTRLETPGIVRVKLRSTDALIELEVPDLSGEVFREHWVERHWKPDFDQQVKAADGIVLMVSTLNKETMLLSELSAATPDPLRDADPRPDPESKSEDEESDNQKRSWDPRETDAQVQLVEHLQFVALRRSQQPVPVAVVLCAWDQVRVVDPEITPGSWLSDRLPLLDQYLEAHRNQFPSTAFGISAQGGELDEKDRLLAMAPVERLYVTDGETSGHDITLPLAWVLDAIPNG